ncbi:MAG TPA: hypothetical protein PKN33_02450 [Phycisphaerae bacterium]|nr:hypothetical protein [Phycisphaerae bacterium]
MMTDPNPHAHSQSGDQPAYPPDEELTTELIEGVTFDDRTPYAHARESGQRAFFKMCRWVWSAGKYRLTHLALSRPSRHSRRFARIHVLMFSIAVAFCVFTNAALHSVRVGPGMQNETTTPAGKGWAEIVTRPFPTPTAFAESVVVSSVWFNATWAAMAAGIAWLVSVVFGMLLVGMFASLARRSLQSEHRTEPLLRCAIHYGTSWLWFPIAAILVLGVRPVAVLGKVAGWTFAPKTIVFDAVALLLTIFGLLLGWFWLIRLGGAVPKGSRKSASRFFIFLGPLSMIIVIGAIGYGMYFLSNELPRRLNLNW